MIYYGNDYIEIGLAVDLSQNKDTSATYTKTEVNDMMEATDTALAAKQNTLTFIDPMNSRTLVASYPLLVGSNIFPRLSAQIPSTLTRNENNYLMLGILTSIFNQSSLSVNTITTSSATLNVKSNQVLFKGNDNSMYLDAHVGGVVRWTDFYTDGMIKNRNGFSVGDQTSVDTWTSQCSISSTVS